MDVQDPESTILIQNKAIRGWQLYDWADSVSAMAFNYYIPLYINEAGEALGWKGGGKSLWSYLTAVSTISTLFCFITFTSATEYGQLKIQLLRRCTEGAGLCLILLVLCTHPRMIGLAGFLFVLAKLFNRVAGVAYYALLDAVCANCPDQVHRVSAQGYALGYVSMLLFMVLAGGLFTLYLPSVARPGSASEKEAPTYLWLEYACTSSFAGLWLLVFGVGALRLIPNDIYKGRKMEQFGVLDAKETTNGCRGPYKTWMFLKFCIRQGCQDQLVAMKHAWKMRDLRNLLIGFLFLSDSASTVMSVSAIVATEYIGVGAMAVVITATIGVVGAVVGLVVFRALNKRGLSPKTILVINVTLLTAAVVAVPFLKTAAHLYIFAAVCGTQIGSVGAFSRSLLTTMIPFNQQSSFFSLYELTQKGTSWIGPLLVGAGTDIMGDQYYVLIVVVVVLFEICIGFPIFVFLVNPENGNKLRLEKEAEFQETEQEEKAEDAQTVHPEIIESWVDEEENYNERDSSSNIVYKSSNSSQVKLSKILVLRKRSSGSMCSQKAI